MTRATDRLGDLLTRRATEGVDTAAARELEALLATHPEVDADAFDRAAAAVHLALLAPSEPMPAALRARLERAASVALADGD